MLDDRQLLRQYAQDGSEAAFSELVARYVNLVYSAALRRTAGDFARAQDVAQLVFTDLALKACTLSPGIVLAGWLHRATRFAAGQLLRGEHRRQAREQEALAMNALASDPAPDWDQIRPLLDAALDQLDQADRDALLLRYFEQCSLAEVGHRLGSNEEAARKRVSRALDKVRAYLTRRGVTTTAAALTAVISVNAVQVAPAGLAAALTGASLASAAVGAGTLLKMAIMTKLKLSLIGAAVVATVATPLVIHLQTKVKSLTGQNGSAQQLIAQLKNENGQLSNLVAQARNSQTLSRDQLNELMRLRNDVARLRDTAQSRANSPSAAVEKTTRPPNSTGGGYIPKDQLANAGYATPEAALQTYMWAVMSGNYDQIIASMPPQAKAQLQNPEERAIYEQAFRAEMPHFQGMQMIAKKVRSDDLVEVEYVTFTEGKAPHIGIQQMVRIGNEWKFHQSLGDSNWGNSGQVQALLPQASD
jgi:RNA polymerase sigma factor (sigma-70 family)